MNKEIFNFLITSISGLSTMIGAIIIFIFNKKSNKIITRALAFAAGVMLCVSVISLIPNGYLYINNYYNIKYASIIALLFIMLGLMLASVLEKKIKLKNNSALFKIGIISMIVIAIHNILEGMVTFLVINNNMKLGILLALSLAIHNIPEGICISMPIYYSTGNKKKALLYTLLAAVSEPIGAVLAFLFFKNLSDLFIGLLFSFIGGLMIGITIKELIPPSFKDDKKLFFIYFIFGIFIMLLSHIILL